MVSEDMTTLGTEVACAKINLALHVRRRLANGYHDIETVFAFLDCGDVISVSAGTDIQLAISGPFSGGLSNKDNLVLEAAHLLASHAKVEIGAHLTLDKRLPVASGIGGGSADAAATLRLLNRYWELQLNLSDLAKLSETLGADVPACVLNETSCGKGIGQDLVPIKNGPLTGCFGLLVNPLVPISTATVFQQWDGMDRGALSGTDPILAAIAGRNDLQKPAETLAPVIKTILSKLQQTDAVMARMSGSGATCFGLYRTKKQVNGAEKMITETLPGAWTMVGGLK